MARRGRGAAAARPDTAPDGPDGAVNGTDQPGARTMGALAVARWAARKTGEAPEGVDTGVAAMTRGPYDEGDLDPEQTEIDKVDFGAVRIPVPRGGQVSVEPEEGRLQAVHVMLATGRLSVSALAAPRTDRLWPDLAIEIDESLREGGATVRSFTGEWGRELHARTGEASSVFVGVDGPRWMLYGVATGPTSAATELDAALRRMLRGTVVVRGHLPYPVRTVLPLTVPEHLADPPIGAEQVPAARVAEPTRRASPGRPDGAGPGAGAAAAAPVGPRNGAAPGRPGAGASPSDPWRPGPVPPAPAPAVPVAPVPVAPVPVAPVPVAPVPVAPVPVPTAGELPTEPYGLPRVDAPAYRAADPGRNGRSPVNGTSPAAPAARRTSTTGAGTSAAARNPAARNGAAAGSDRDQGTPRAERSPAARTDGDTGRTGQRRVADLLAAAKRDDGDVGRTGQRRVADLLAAAERDRRAAAEVRPSPAVPGEARPPAAYRAARPAPVEPTSARPVVPDAAAVPSRPVEPAPSRPPRYSDEAPGMTPQRLGAAPRARDDGRPDFGASPSSRDGSDDWTVPMSIVSPGAATPPAPSRDLWADDPWATEARQAARAARAAESRAAEARAAEVRAAEQRAAEVRAAEQRAAEVRAAEVRAAEARAAEVRAAGQRAAEARAAEVRAAEQRAAEVRAAEARAAERRVAPPRAARNGAAARPDEPAEWTAHQRPAHHRPAHHRAAHESPGSGQHGSGQHGSGQHGSGQHGTGQHGTGQHGTGQHGADRYGADRYGAGPFGAGPSGADRYRYDRHGTGRPGVDGPHGEPAVDVPAARVPPALRPAWAYLADERIDPFDEPESGRHRRPDR